MVITYFILPSHYGIYQSLMQGERVTGLSPSMKRRLLSRKKMKKAYGKPAATFAGERAELLQKAQASEFAPQAINTPSSACERRDHCHPSIRARTRRHILTSPIPASQSKFRPRPERAIGIIGLRRARQLLPVRALIAKHEV